MGAQWPGYEPNRGEFHPEYLDTLNEIADAAAQYGIYTLMDFHQDILSEKFCGEGIPLWAAEATHSFYNKFPLPLAMPYSVDERGVPTREDCLQINWGMYGGTMAALHGYQALYSNHDGIQDAFGNFWRAVAASVKGKDHVLGFDLINEPNYGDVFTRPWLLLNGWADHYNLQPMYDNLGRYIREVNDEHIVFIEPTPPDHSNKIGFSHVPGGEAYQNRSGISFHYYSPPNAGIPEHFSGRKSEMRRLRTGGLLSEFNLNFVVFDVILRNGTTAEMLATMDACDEHLISWTGWEYKPYYPITGAGYSVFDGEGNLKLDVLSTLSRPYA